MKGLPSIHTVLVCCLLSGYASTAHAQVYREGIDRAMDIVAATFKDRGDGVLWQQRIEGGGVWMQIHFSGITSPPNADYTVVIRDKNEIAVKRYPAAVFAASDEFLTHVLYTSIAAVQVEGKNVGGLRFTIDVVTIEADSIGRFMPQSIIPNWRTVDEAATRLKKPELFEWSRSVAKLYMPGGYVCSGFLVAPNLLLTNNHCLVKSLLFSRSQGAALEKRQCSDIELQFDFDQQPAPQRSSSTRCTRVRDFDPALDFALLELNADAIVIEKKPRPALRLLDSADAYTGPVLLLHHPAGLSKKVSFSCDLIKAGGAFEHDCSSAGGSSGAPILDEAGRVVGLHFAGPYPETMTIGQIEAALARGVVFRNKAKAAAAFRERVAPLLPPPPPPPPRPSKRTIP